MKDGTPTILHTEETRKYPRHIKYYNAVLSASTIDADI